MFLRPENSTLAVYYIARVPLRAAALLRFLAHGTCNNRTRGVPAAATSSQLCSNIHDPPPSSMKEDAGRYSYALLFRVLRAGSFKSYGGYCSIRGTPVSSQTSVKEGSFQKQPAVDLLYVGTTWIQDEEHWSTRLPQRKCCGGKFIFHLRLWTPGIIRHSSKACTSFGSGLQLHWDAPAPLHYIQQYCRVIAR